MSSEEYTEGYGKIEESGFNTRRNEYNSDSNYLRHLDFYCKIHNEIKKIENGYFIKCLSIFINYTSGYIHNVWLIDNYGNCTSYSSNSSAQFPLSLNIKNKNYKLSNKLIDLVKSIKVHTQYNFDIMGRDRLSFNEYELYIDDFFSNIQMLAEDNYKKYMEINVLKAQNNILKLK